MRLLTTRVRLSGETRATPGPSPVAATATWRRLSRSSTLTVFDAEFAT